MSDVDQVARQLHAAGFLVTIDLRVEAAGAAAFLGVTPKTLRNQRSELRGPQWELRHGLAYYAISDLLDWRGGTRASLGSRDVVEQTHSP